MKKFFVEIVEIDTDDVVKMHGPMSEREVDRAWDGLVLNLDHEKHYPRIVPSVENALEGES